MNVRLAVAPPACVAGELGGPTGTTTECELPAPRTAGPPAVEAGAGVTVTVAVSTGVAVGVVVSPSVAVGVGPEGDGCVPGKRVEVAGGVDLDEIDVEVGVPFGVGLCEVAMADGVNVGEEEVPVGDGGTRRPVAVGVSLGVSATVELFVSVTVGV